MVLPEALNILIYVIIIVVVIVLIVWLLDRIVFFIAVQVETQGHAPPITLNPMQYADKYRSDYTFPFYVALIGFSGSMF